MKQLALGIIIISVCLMTSAAWASKSYTVDVPTGESLTVVTPCKLKPVFHTDDVGVQGQDNVVTILSQNKTTVTLVCDSGNWAYAITVNPSDNKDAVTLFNIKDPEYDAWLEEQKKLKDTSNYDKEDLLNESRSVLVAMIKDRPLEGYERKKLSDHEKTDGSLSYQATELYNGQLFGLIYTLKNESAMTAQYNISDFSTRGVIYLYSPSMSDTGNIVLEPGSQIQLYVVKAGDDPYYALPWKESGGNGVQMPTAMSQQIPPVDMKAIIPTIGGQ